jgi:hypothetical protein
VISDLINADLVVADLTDLNPNALYELGIRHSTLKPTIHVARAGTKLPFDTISHRTIFIDVSDWHSIVDGRKALAAAVKATQATGYRVTNPITQANASFKMRESDDPRDRVLGEIQERLGALEARSSANVLRLADGSYIRRSFSALTAEDELVKAIMVNDLDEAAMLFARWTTSTANEGKKFVEAIKARQSRMAARIHMVATKSTDEIQSLNVAHRLINRIP